MVKIQILAVGSRVVVGTHKGFVTAAMIEERESVSYRVSYWEDGSRKQEWFDRYECEPEDEAELRWYEVIVKGGV